MSAPTSPARRARAAAVSALAVVGSLLPTAAAAEARPHFDELPTVSSAPAGERNYIVTLDDATPSAADLPVGDLREALSGEAFDGAVVSMTRDEARELGRQDGVESVEPDRRIEAWDKQPLEAEGAGSSTVTAGSVPWGLDRADQRMLPLDGSYTAAGNGQGVHAFVLDSGIDVEHPEFSGRVTSGAYAYGSSVQDCDGHGTHVAGTIGSTLHGLAPGVTIHPVKVLDCDGSGSTSAILAGMNWIAANAEWHSVVNISLGGNYSPAINQAARALVDQGLVVVVAAGNEGRDAGGYSPASEPSVLTVAALDSSDAETDFTNVGASVDIFAPGEDIVSTALGSSTGGAVMSGSSMSSPHVAGAAAVYWGLHPSANGPAVAQEIMNSATPGVITFPWGQGASPDRNLHVPWTGAEQPAEQPVPSPPAQPAPAPEATVSSAPSRPAKVRARPRKGQRVLVTWKPVSGSTVDYAVQMRRKARGSWATVSVTRVNSWSGRLPVARSVKRVKIRVVATNRDGVSGRPSRTVPVRVRR